MDKVRVINFATGKAEYYTMQELQNYREYGFPKAEEQVLVGEVISAAEARRTASSLSRTTQQRQPERPTKRFWREMHFCEICGHMRGPHHRH